MVGTIIKEDQPFWKTGTFWSAVLMVVAYACRHIWGLVITDEQQAAIVNLILELITVFGMAGTVFGAFLAHKKVTDV